MRAQKKSSSTGHRRSASSPRIRQSLVSSHLISSPHVPFQELSELTTTWFDYYRNENRHSKHTLSLSLDFLNNTSPLLCQERTASRTNSARATTNRSHRKFTKSDFLDYHPDQPQAGRKNDIGSPIFHVCWSYCKNTPQVSLKMRHQFLH